MSEKSGCAGLFRQVCAVSLSPLRGSRAGNGVRKPCCARLRLLTKCGVQGDHPPAGVWGRAPKPYAAAFFVSVASVQRTQETRLFPKPGFFQRSEPCCARLPNPPHMSLYSEYSSEGCGPPNLPESFLTAWRRGAIRAAPDAGFSSEGPAPPGRSPGAECCGS